LPHIFSIDFPVYQCFIHLASSLMRYLLKLTHMFYMCNVNLNLVACFIRS
jgi:hypothetical protein